MAENKAEDAVRLPHSDGQTSTSQSNIVESNQSKSKIKKLVTDKVILSERKKKVVKMWKIIDEEKMRLK